MSVQFVIVGAPRTGSTLLVKTLDSLAQVLCHGELLGLNRVRGYEDGFDPELASQSAREERAARLLRERDADPLAFIQAALQSDNAATGFKALYDAINHPQWHAVKEWLLATPGLRFIHLVRGNDLRRYVSEQIFLAGGPNHSLAGGRSGNTMQVHVDIEDFQRSAAELGAEVHRMRDLLAACSVMEVTYEALSGDTPETVAQVCAFLDLQVPASSIVPALQKVGSTDLRETVSNYGELLAHDATRELARRD